MSLGIKILDPFENKLVHLACEPNKFKVSDLQASSLFFFAKFNLFCMKTLTYRIPYFMILYSIDIDMHKKLRSFLNEYRTLNLQKILLI